MRPKLPTEASLAAAAAAATAAATAAQEAKQKAVETAQPQRASTVSAVAKPDTQHETQSLVKIDPSPQTDLPAETGPPASAADVVQKPSSGAVPPPGAVAPALEGPSAGAVPDPMDVDMPDVIPVLDSKEPEPAEAALNAESDQQPSAELPPSDLEKSVPIPVFCWLFLLFFLLLVASLIDLNKPPILLLPLPHDDTWTVGYMMYHTTMDCITW